MRVFGKFLQTFQLSRSLSCSTTTRRYSSTICAYFGFSPRIQQNPQLVRSYTSSRYYGSKSGNSKFINRNLGRNSGKKSKNDTDDGDDTASTTDNITNINNTNNDNSPCNIVPVAIIKSSSHNTFGLKVLLIPINLFEGDDEAAQKTLATISIIRDNAKQIEAFAENLTLDPEYPSTSNLTLPMLQDTKTNNSILSNDEILPEVQDDNLEFWQNELANEKALRDDNALYDGLEQAIAEHDINNVQSQNAFDVIAWNDSKRQMFAYIPESLEEKLNKMAIASMHLAFEMNMTNIRDAILMGPGSNNIDLYNVPPPKSLKDPTLSLTTCLDMSPHQQQAMVPLNFNALIQGTIEIDSSKFSPEQLRDIKIPEFNDYMTTIAAHICSSALQKGFPADISRMSYSTKSTSSKPPQSRNPHIVCVREGDKGCVSPGNAHYPMYKSLSSGGSGSSSAGSVSCKSPQTTSTSTKSRKASSDSSESCDKKNDSSLLSSAIIGDCGARGLMSCKAYANAIAEAAKRREAAKGDKSKKKSCKNSATAEKKVEKKSCKEQLKEDPCKADAKEAKKPTCKKSCAEKKESKQKCAATEPEKKPPKDKPKCEDPKPPDCTPHEPKLPCGPPNEEPAKPNKNCAPKKDSTSKKEQDGCKKKKDTKPVCSEKSKDKSSDKKCATPKPCKPAEKKTSSCATKTEKPKCATPKPCQPPKKKIAIAPCDSKPEKQKCATPKPCKPAEKKDTKCNSKTEKQKCTAPKPCKLPDKKDSKCESKVEKVQCIKPKPCKSPQQKAAPNEQPMSKHPCANASSKKDKDKGKGKCILPDPCKDPCEEPPKKKKEKPCKNEDPPCKKIRSPCKGPGDNCKKPDPKSCKSESKDKCDMKKKDPCKSEKKDPCKSKKKDPCKEKNPDPCKDKKKDKCGSEKKKDKCGSEKKKDKCGSEKKKDKCGGEKKQDKCAADKKKDKCGSEKKKDPCNAPEKKKEESAKCNTEDPCKAMENKCESKSKSKCGGDTAKKEKTNPCKKATSDAKPACNMEKKDKCGDQKSAKKNDTVCGKEKKDTKPICKNDKGDTKSGSKGSDPCKKSFSTSAVANWNRDLFWSNKRNFSTLTIASFRYFSSKKDGKKEESGKCTAIKSKIPKNRKTVKREKKKCYADYDDECPKKFCKDPKDSSCNNKNKKENKNSTPWGIFATTCMTTTLKTKKSLTNQLLQRYFGTSTVYRTRFTNQDDDECDIERADYQNDMQNEVVKIIDACTVERVCENVPNFSDYDVLIRTAAVAISGSDVHVYESGGKACPGMTIGHDASGVVEKVGKCIYCIKPGDRVAVESGLSCGICDFCKRGAYNMCSQLIYNGFLSTFQVHPADLCHKIPNNITMEEGSLTQTLALGCQACFKAHITPTTNVLIVGSSATAISAALCARAIGAKQVCIASTMQSALEASRELFSLDCVHYDCTMNFGEALEGIFCVMNDWPDVVINCAISETTMNLAIMALQPCGTCILAECEAECACFNSLDVLMKNLSLVPSFRSTNMFPTALQLMQSGRAPICQLIARVFGWQQVATAFRSAQHESNVGNRKVIVNCAELENSKVTKT